MLSFAVCYIFKEACIFNEDIKLWSVQLKYTYNCFDGMTARTEHMYSCVALYAYFIKSA